MKGMKLISLMALALLLAGILGGIGGAEARSAPKGKGKKDKGGKKDRSKRLEKPIKPLATCILQTFKSFEACEGEEEPRYVWRMGHPDKCNSFVNPWDNQEDFVTFKADLTSQADGQRRLHGIKLFGWGAENTEADKKCKSEPYLAVPELPVGECTFSEYSSDAIVYGTFKVVCTY